jgi:hypothetical protein
MSAQPLDPEQNGAINRIDLARIDTKLDVLIAQHGNTANQVADHETRIRLIEADQVRTDAKVADLIARDTDQEARLRAADRWRYALPITAVGAAAAAVASVVSALGN